MNNLKIFKNEMFEVSIQLENGEVLFDVENVARCLGIIEKKLDVNYVRWSRVNSYLPKNSPQVAKGDFIPESLVYKLAFKANNEVAEKFQDWLAIEVLPSIRKHGMYAKDELLNNPDLLLDVIKRYKEEREQKQLLELQLEKDKPKVLFAEAVENSDDVILVKEMATILTQKGFTIGQNQLFQYLRDNGFLCKKKGDMYHLPTKRYEHLFKVIKNTVQSSKGSIVRNTPKITGKGQMYFMKRFNDYSEDGITIKDLLASENEAV